MSKYPISIIITLLLFGGFSGYLRAEEVLTWQDCIEEAAKNHPDLIFAEEGIRASRATKAITVSPLLPQIKGKVDASTSGSEGITTDSYSHGVTATQLLFDGFKTYDNVKAAAENIKAAQYTYRFTSSEVRSRLRTAFINLLKAQELLNITEEIFRIRRGNFELISLRYESGLEHRGALLTAEANLVQAQFEIIQAKRALEVAQRQLAKEMGRKEVSPLCAEGDFKVGDTALEKPDFVALAKNHPSLAKLIAQKNAAYFDIRAAEADFFPRLSGDAGRTKSGYKWPPQDNSWNAGLSLSFPLFEGGSRLAALDKAKAIFNQAQANERSSKDGIILTLEQTWAALQDAVETVEVQKKFLEAAEERARIAEVQYSLGLIDFNNWTIIEDELVKTKKAVLGAQANALLGEASWVQAKGETLEYAQN